MKNKSTLYIGAFTLLFLLLIGIHGYYFYNSYKLKEKEITNNVNAKLSDLEDHIPPFADSPVMEDEIAIVFSNFENKKISKSQVIQYIRAKNKKASPLVSAYIDSLFQPQGYKVALRKELKNLISLPTQDTLIKESLILYESTNRINTVRKIIEGKWTTSSINSESDLKEYEEFPLKKKPDFHFQINRVTYYDILNLNHIVLKELTPLIVSSILILLSVLLLYYLTYKNLVKHKQESLILHDIVDNISHEFKTPLATLKIATKTLYKDNSQEILPLMERQLDRLENLLKPIQMDQELNTNTSIVVELDIQNILRDFSFSQPDIILNTHLDISKPLPLYKVEIETILHNLLDNAYKYDSKQIDISIKSIGNEFLLLVKDDGIGMEHQQIKHITKKFYRIQKDNIQNTKGLGLGLYLVNKIVQKHHGTIQITSKLALGTCVKIKIPNEN